MRQRAIDRTAHLEIWTQYAPKRGNEPKRCPCKFGDWCAVTVQAGWILCEAPDHKMLLHGWTLDEFFTISTEACADVWNKKGE
jgi:hypothetical protein